MSLKLAGSSGAAAAAVTGPTSVLSPGLHVGPSFLVLGATSSSDLDKCVSAGCTHALVQAAWDQCQSTVGGAVSMSAINTQIDLALAKGLQVCLEFAIQYPPSFVLTGVPQFKDQSGNLADGSAGSGAQVRDWVWSQTGRNYVADFISKAFAGIGATRLAKIDRMRLGGGVNNELNYPLQATPPQWWGFSAAAQSGTDLARGQQVCPSPGTGNAPEASVSSGPSPWDANDRLWVEWYEQSLDNFMRWLIAQHRASFRGPIWILHPSSGVRPIVEQPNSSTKTAADAYRQSTAAGTNWLRQIANYPDEQCWPYSTWADSDHFYTPDPFNPAADTNSAPGWYLRWCARQLGRDARIWGENTGGQSNSDMSRMFASGCIPWGFEGVNWLSAASLDTGSPATWANLTTLIASVLG